MISANMIGELNIHVETDVVTVTTYHKRLTNHYYGMITLFLT